MKKYCLVFVIALSFLTASSQVLETSMKDYSLNSKSFVSLPQNTFSKAKNRKNFGYFAAPTMLGLCIFSEITKDNTIPSLPLGIAATSLMFFSVPYISAGGKCVDFTGINRNDYMKLRVLANMSWGFYLGGGMIATSLVVLGVLGIIPPTPLITFAGVMGGTSILLMTSALNIGIKKGNGFFCNTYSPRLNFTVSYDNFAALGGLKFSF